MIILSAFFFACMNVSVRLAGNLPSVEKSFFRNLVAAVFAAVILCKDHTLPKVNKKYWGPLILRCVCGTMGILCNFYAIDHLLVADASILNKLSPFFAIIFSFLLLIRFLITIAIINSCITIIAIIVIPYCSILLISCVLYIFLISTLLL